MGTVCRHPTHGPENEVGHPTAGRHIGHTGHRVFRQRLRPSYRPQAMPVISSAKVITPFLIFWEDSLVPLFQIMRRHKIGDKQKAWTVHLSYRAPCGNHQNAKNIPQLSQDVFVPQRRFTVSGQKSSRITREKAPLEFSIIYYFKKKSQESTERRRNIRAKEKAASESITYSFWLPQLDSNQRHRG